MLARLAPGENIEAMPFMSARAIRLSGVEAHVSRSGYTGEDGFEISLAAESAEAFARRLLAEPEVKPIGLGARDSLRLEAGLCLYGHELDETIDPIEAGLTWSIQKRRRIEGGFPGAARIQAALANGPRRKRVGIGLDRPRAGARRRRDRRRGRRRHRRRHLGRLWPERRRADRHGLCRKPNLPRRERRSA